MGLCIKTDKHIYLQAGNREGKGTSWIIPNLLMYRGSAFVLDPKGENCRATLRRRLQLNDICHTLDPFGITGKPPSRFNPLATFTPENMERQSKSLALALVMGQPDKPRDFWTMSAQSLVALAIKYVCTAPEIPPDHKDLVTVRNTLLGHLPQMLESCLHSEVADGSLADQAQSFILTPERMYGDIVATAQRETDILDEPALRRSLAASGPGEEVHFADWHSKTMTVYLCLSAVHFAVYNRWLRLVLTSALDEMTAVLAPPKLPVSFVLDELATLGHLEAIENAVGLAAGYGVQLVTVWQDIAQLKALYRQRWASFIGNSGVKVLFGIEDVDSAKYWSDTIGQHQVETHSRQEDIYGLSKGGNTSERRVRLFCYDASNLSTRLPLCPLLSSVFASSNQVQYGASHGHL